jgi:regulator of protease activity HflC (stomatin/prohibitin superfamily)
MDEGKRIEKVSSQVLATVKGVIGDESVNDKPEEVMSDKVAFAEKIKAAADIATVCDLVGYTLVDLTISDVDFTEAVEKAHEQTTIAEKNIKSTRKILSAWGVKKKDYQLDPNTHTPEEVAAARREYKALVSEALDNVKESAGQITRKIIDVRGLKNADGTSARLEVSDK